MDIDKTNKTLYGMLYIGGLAILVISFIFVIISDWTDLLPESDWPYAVIILFWPIAWLGEYFRPITDKDQLNSGCLFPLYTCLLLMMPLSWWWNIKHFTAPIVVILVAAGALMILDIILFYKKSRRIKAMEEEENG